MPFFIHFPRLVGIRSTVHPGGEGRLLLTSKSKRNFHNIKCPILPSQGTNISHHSREVQKIIDSKVPARLVGDMWSETLEGSVVFAIRFITYHARCHEIVLFSCFCPLVCWELSQKNQGPKSYHTFSWFDPSIHGYNSMTHPFCSKISPQAGPKSSGLHGFHCMW